MIYFHSMKCIWECGLQMVAILFRLPRVKHECGRTYRTCRKRIFPIACCERSPETDALFPRNIHYTENSNDEAGNSQTKWFIIASHIFIDIHAHI